jgi:hypothetical protein
MHRLRGPTSEKEAKGSLKVFTLVGREVEHIDGWDAAPDPVQLA